MRSVEFGCWSPTIVLTFITVDHKAVPLPGSRILPTIVTFTVDGVYLALLTIYTVHLQSNIHNLLYFVFSGWKDSLMSYPKKWLSSGGSTDEHGFPEVSAHVSGICCERMYPHETVAIQSSWFNSSMAVTVERFRLCIWHVRGNIWWCVEVPVCLSGEKHIMTRLIRKKKKTR